MPLLSWRDRLRGSAEAGGASCFDLDENQIPVVVEGDDIQFAVAGSPVTLDHPPSTVDEQIAGQTLPKNPQIAPSEAGIGETRSGACGCARTVSGGVGSRTVWITSYGRPEAVG